MSNSTTNATSKHFAPYTQTCSMSTISDKKLSGKVYFEQKCNHFVPYTANKLHGSWDCFQCWLSTDTCPLGELFRKVPLNPFVPKLNFYTSRKHRKTFGFAGVSMEYKIITLTTNGFKDENILGKLMCKN